MIPYSKYKVFSFLILMTVLQYLKHHMLYPIFLILMYLSLIK